MGNGGMEMGDEFMCIEEGAWVGIEQRKGSGSMQCDWGS